MTIRFEDRQVEGVKVKFTYGDQVKEATTDNDGWAKVNFNYTADIGVEANPEENYQTKSVEIRAPKPEECDGQGGPSNGSSGGSSSNGEILGSSTMAPTGAVSDLVLNTVGNLGGILTIAGSALYAQKRKAHFPR